VSGRRVRRLNQLLREELSRLIRREVKDPRVGLITVTGVEATADLEHADVFVRTVETDRDLGEMIDGLQSAAGYLRHALGKELHLRRIPELTFREDRSLERARRIESLLDEALGPEREADGGGGGEDGGAAD